MNKLELLLLLLAASTDCALAADSLPSELPTSLSHAGLETPDSLTAVIDHSAPAAAAAATTIMAVGDSITFGCGY
jgi:hypothetical protein